MLCACSQGDPLVTFTQLHQKENTIEPGPSNLCSSLEHFAALDCVDDAVHLGADGLNLVVPLQQQLVLVKVNHVLHLQASRQVA